MCFGSVIDFLFGGGKQQVAPQTTAPTPQPAPTPKESASAPDPDTKRSAEMDKAGADRSGFSALIIPRTSFPQVNRSVPTG